MSRSWICLSDGNPAGINVCDCSGEDGGMKVVGHPLGCAEYCRRVYDAKAEATVQAVDKLKSLIEYGNQSSVQASYLLLRWASEPVKSGLF